MTRPDGANLRSGPLDGITLLVTRSQEQSGELSDALRRLGGRVIEAPVIAFAEPEDWSGVDEAIGRIDSYDWIVFTSANAVERFLGRCTAVGLAADRLSRTRLAAIGPATARGLAAKGLDVSAIPSSHRAEGLLEALGATAMTGLEILIPRAQVAREVLPSTLRSLGAKVDVVTVYRTVPVPVERRIQELLSSGGIDIVTFTSSSTVTNLLAGIEEAGALRNPIIAVIGPVTAETVKKNGLIPAIVAGRSTIEDLVEAITGWVRSRRQKAR